MRAPIGLVVAAALAWGGPASAQTRFIDPGTQPGFVTLDRMDGVSRVGVQLGLDKLDDVDLSEAFGLRTELYGQVLLAGRRAGFYGQLPFSMLILDGAEDRQALGNLELGGLYVVRRPGRADVVFRGGLALPTADDGPDGIASLFTLGERLTDYPGVTPDTTWLRLSCSPILRSGNVFLRGDLGFDLPFADDGGDDDLMAHLSGGLGLLTGTLVFTAELVNMGKVDGDGELSDRFAHTLAVSLRSAGRNQIHFGAVFPLDEDARGDVWIFSLGFQQVLR